MGDFVVVMVTVTGVGIAFLAAVTLARGYVRRLPERSAAGHLSHEELDALRARLDALEQREQETEERVDFVERALSQSREARRLRDTSEKQ